MVMNNTTKKRLFFLGLIGLVVFLISRYSVDIGICDNYSSNCFDYGYVLMLYSLISIPFILFSIITYKLRQQAFDSWRNFSIIWIPLSFLVISFFPTETHGMDFFPVIKGTVSLFLASVYSIISLLIILFKSFKKN